MTINKLLLMLLMLYTHFLKNIENGSLTSKCNFNRLALKSGIDGHHDSPQVGHSRPANTSQRLNSVYVVASSD